MDCPSGYRQVPSFCCTAPGVPFLGLFSQVESSGGVLGSETLCSRISVILRRLCSFP